MQRFFTDFAQVPALKYLRVPAPLMAVTYGAPAAQPHSIRIFRTKFSLNLPRGAFSEITSRISSFSKASHALHFAVTGAAA